MCSETIFEFLVTGYWPLGLLSKKQGRIHGQKVVAGGWAGAVMRWVGTEWGRVGAVV